MREFSLGTLPCLSSLSVHLGHFHEGDSPHLNEGITRLGAHTSTARGASCSCEPLTSRSLASATHSAPVHSLMCTSQREPQRPAPTCSRPPGPDHAAAVPCTSRRAMAPDRCGGPAASRHERRRYQCRRATVAPRHKWRCVVRVALRGAALWRGPVAAARRRFPDAAPVEPRLTAGGGR